MRRVTNLNKGWQFIKNSSDPAVSTGLSYVDLPHTWNAKDGQDGGNDYFRGSCVYKKELDVKGLPSDYRHYLEIKGANSSADVYIGGRHLAHHDGGYSTWRVDITDALKDSRELAIVVDNSPNDSVYPQMADFTFYGGLYRDVDLISVAPTHFDLESYGGSGIAITPRIDGKDAEVKIDVYTTPLSDGDLICYTVTDKEGKTVSERRCECSCVTVNIPSVHLWDGARDPYLYTARAAILRGGEELDSVSARFGCRSFEIDPERGFILNGREYPLRGVSRHQDRLGIGNALLPEHHREDIELICELGANTVRLAHYQHDQYFYDLCDERGLTVWAEIPYISRHMPNGRENTATQMKELITQNYNHPSVIVWGLSNEITMGGADDPDLIENHKMLNELVHSMDKTRPTTMACVTVCGIDEPYVQIPDTVAYNHYFGWYGGDVSMNGPWFDKFHEAYPDKPIGVSEYGCEGLNWHTSEPRQGDYTEEYQAYYHEELIKQLFARKYLWATYVWNMFDFGADARCEGGENGQNHKGLVTFDRGYKKDAFYAYKAWLSDEPFVHICGKRYVDRVEDVTSITVYSNQAEIELYVNGKSIGKKKSDDHFFRFEVENRGESEIIARCGELSDESRIRKVEVMNEDYILKDKHAVLNWFDIEAPEGRFSLNDTISDILSTDKGKAWFGAIAERLQGAGVGAGAGFEVGADMMNMLGGFTVLRFTGMLGMMNIEFTRDELLRMNSELNAIEKTQK